jgi:flagellar motor switch protein FliG
MYRQTSRAGIYRDGTINSIVNPKGFLKTGYGHKRAAKLLLLLGKDQAAEILRHLSQEEVEKITAEIAKIKRIDRDEALKILEEFGAVAGAIAATPRGGVQVARDILEASIGKEKAREVLEKLPPYLEQKPFSFLNDLEYQQIMLLLRKEPIHVVSIVISCLKPEKASQVLESFPPEIQAQTVRRIARLGRVSPEVLSSIEDGLRERIRTQGRVVTEEIDGQSVLADILKHLPLQDEDRILDFLEMKNTELAGEIREKLFTIEMILDIPDVQLQGVLQHYPDRDLAILLKGKSEELEHSILRNVSARRAEFIREERRTLGPMKRSEVDRVTKDFLLNLRSLVERGDIVINSDELV